MGDALAVYGAALVGRWAAARQRVSSSVGGLSRTASGTVSTPRPEPPAGVARSGPSAPGASPVAEVEAVERAVLRLARASDLAAAAEGRLEDAAVSAARAAIAAASRVVSARSAWARLSATQCMGEFALAGASAQAGAMAAAWSARAASARAQWTQAALATLAAEARLVQLTGGRAAPGVLVAARAVGAAVGSVARGYAQRLSHATHTEPALPILRAEGRTPPRPGAPSPLGGAAVRAVLGPGGGVRGEAGRRQTDEAGYPGALANTRPPDLASSVAVGGPVLERAVRLLESIDARLAHATHAGLRAGGDLGTLLRESYAGM